MPRKPDPDRTLHAGRTSASRACAPVSEQSVQSASHDSLEMAADALLRIVVTGERQRSAAANSDWQKGRPWTDTLAQPSTDILDVLGLATDPIGTACRAELRRIGHALHAADPGEDFAALEVEIAEMDPTHAGWRAMVLEMAWAGIGGPVV